MPGNVDVDSIPISALEHWAYCPRQCGLIHLEREFEDNVHTARGQAVHRLVDAPGYAIQDGVKVERALPLWSERLGLIGKADLVEFHPDGTVFPVEFKHGRKRQKLHDDLQLAAQALCLEEMLGHPVRKGAIYHASSRRRREVVITPELVRLVEETTAAIRAMLANGILPPPADDARCTECSLRSICQPQAIDAKARIRALRESLFQVENETPCTPCSTPSTS